VAICCMNKIVARFFVNQIATVHAYAQFHAMDFAKTLIILFIARVDVFQLSNF
jgi:hypothetical protein